MDEGESIKLHKNIYLIFHNTTYNDFYFQSFIVCNRKVNEFFFSFCSIALENGLLIKR